MNNRAASEELIGDGDWAAEEEGFGSDTFTETRHPERAEALTRRAEMLLAILVIRADGQITRNGDLVRRFTRTSGPITWPVPEPPWLAS